MDLCASLLQADVLHLCCLFRDGCSLHFRSRNSVFAIRFIFYFIFLFGVIFEIFFEPLRAAERGAMHVVAVDYDIGRFVGFEFRIAQINAGGLQRVEHQACCLVIDASGAEHLDRLHQRYLHRVRVFEQRQIETALRRHVFGDLCALAPDALVKEALSPVAERRRSALRPVHLYVLTSWNIIHPHIFFSRPLRRFAGTKFAGYPPPPPSISGIIGLGWNSSAKSGRQRS